MTISFEKTVLQNMFVIKRIRIIMVAFVALLHVLGFVLIIKRNLVIDYQSLLMSAMVAVNAAHVNIVKENQRNLIQQIKEGQ